MKINDQKIKNHSEDDWKFGIQGKESTQTLNIVAKHKTKDCKLTLTDKMKLVPRGNDC